MSPFGPITRALRDLVSRLQAASANQGRLANLARSPPLSLAHLGAEQAYLNCRDWVLAVMAGLAQYQPAEPVALAEAVAELAAKVDGLAAEVKALRKQ